MNAPRIAVVGSYATGLTMKVERLPCTGETRLGTGYRVDFGGKGSNQAIGCSRLGAAVSFVAKIGNDSFGESALGLYRDEGINVTCLRRTSEAPTGVGFIMVEASTGENCIVLDPGANELLNVDDVIAAEPALNSAAVVLTQLEIPIQAAQAALNYGRAHGAITLLNPAPVRFIPDSFLEMIDILTPNETEARVLAGHDPRSTIAPQDVARELLRKGVKCVITTLGEKGALLVNESAMVHVSAIQVSAVDTTGAGDAFNAGLATALAFGASLEHAVRFAVIIGGLAVAKEGVIPALPKREDVLSYFRNNGQTPPAWFLSWMQ